MLARKSTNLILTKRLFRFNKCLLNLNLKHTMSTVDNKKLFLTDQYDQFTFGELNNLSSKLSKQILDNQNTIDLKGEKIAVLCSNNYHITPTQSF